MKLVTAVSTVLLIGVGASSGQSVVINEIGWMGTAAAAEDEWLELYNASDNAVDVNGWTLKALDGSPSITLAGVISPHGFFLLERTDETTLSDCAANQIYSGAMANTGENFQLADPGGTVRDAVDCSGGWFAGSSSAKTSMERRHPGLDGGYASSWASNNTVVRNGLDSQGGSVNGTPGQPNSVFDSSLPVELELFTAAWHEGKVILEWSVQSQVNNHGYVVLRSDTETEPGRCISGLIAGDGTTSERKRYRYEDDRIIQGRRYWYQLQQLDLDGSSKLHGAISVFAGDGGPFVPNENRLLAGYPNPFNPDVTLQLELAQPAVVEAEVLDLLGRRLRRLVQPTLLRAGIHQFFWDGCDANGRPVCAGVYFIRFFTDRHESLIDKLVKCN